ncbi:MAG: hypothetical protein SAK29_26435 [Scytonema sp. PMC 1069.18]|nr:hypothetical protein [Scytonema sp. PMC 1069.18]MEC4887987.1 hypothetical protein [Scytonema sp. PMC 1070.18]
MTSEFSATPKSAQNQVSNDLIVQARSLYEEATNLMLQAGQLFEQAKELGKKNFTKLIKAEGVEPATANRLIKAAKVGDRFPSQLACQLGLHILLKLSQPSNSKAIEAIAQQESCTQLKALDIIKEHHQPIPKNPPKQVQWQTHNDNSNTLILRIPECKAAERFVDLWKASNETPLPIFMGELLDKAASQPLTALIPQSDRTPQPTPSTPIQANLELLQSTNNQSEITVILREIDRLEQIVQKISNPIDATERMILRLTMDEISALKNQLAIFRSQIA